MEVICLETEAFYTLIEKVVIRIESSRIEKPKWIKLDECMSILGVKSKTTIQKLRDTGEIRFSQQNRRIILYDRDSLDEYLERNAKSTF